MPLVGLRRFAPNPTYEIEGLKRFALAAQRSTDRKQTAAGITGRELVRALDGVRQIEHARLQAEIGAQSFHQLRHRFAERRDYQLRDRRLLEGAVVIIQRALHFQRQRIEQPRGLPVGDRFLQALLADVQCARQIQRLIAAGFPVMAEKGYYTYDMTGRYGWLGHYQFVTGYDQAKGVLVVQDTYIEGGENHEFTYADFTGGWRAFDYLFMVVYPLDREAEVVTLLGDWANEDWAARHALEIAQAEVQSLAGIDQYFAAFNIGTSHVNLREYIDAAYAYDYAFQLYAAMGEDDLRPYRMLWYQTGPYFAYYYSGRYQDVIDLAYVTFDTIGDDVLEESWHWLGMGKLALGDTDGAIVDFREAVRLHPGFAASLYQLELLGVTP